MRRGVGGKRIRLDDPIPPEYENPQTPMTPAADCEMEQDNWYTRVYSINPGTPQNSGSEMYMESEYDRDSSYEQNDQDQAEGGFYTVRPMHNPMQIDFRRYERHYKFPPVLSFA